MREYCGCRAPETIDELIREHNEVVRLISHLRTAPTGAATRPGRAVGLCRPG